jgi:hypothetical protein
VRANQPTTGDSLPDPSASYKNCLCRGRRGISADCCHCYPIASRRRRISLIIYHHHSPSARPARHDVSLQMTRRPLCALPSDYKLLLLPWQSPRPDVTHLSSPTPTPPPESPHRLNIGRDCVALLWWVVVCVPTWWGSAGLVCHQLCARERRLVRDSLVLAALLRFWLRRADLPVRRSQKFTPTTTTTQVQ